MSSIRCSSPTLLPLDLSVVVAVAIAKASALATRCKAFLQVLSLSLPGCDVVHPDQLILVVGLFSGFRSSLVTLSPRV